MFPRDHWCNCIQQYELGNLERCAEIVMQAQCAMERNIGSNSNETFNQRGAAQCRESFSGTPSTNPLAKQPSKSNPKRDLLVAKSRREFATCFLQSRPSCAAVLTRWLCRLGRRCNVRFLIAAIRLALATLDRIAGRTTVPSAPPAAGGTSIGLTHTALHRIARRAAVPSSPAISIAVRRRRTVSRRRVIILRIDNC